MRILVVVASSNDFEPPAPWEAAEAVVDFLAEEGYEVRILEVREVREDEAKRFMWRWLQETRRLEEKVGSKLIKEVQDVFSALEVLKLITRKFGLVKCLTEMIWLIDDETVEPLPAMKVKNIFSNPPAGARYYLLTLSF